MCCNEFSENGAAKISCSQECCGDIVNLKTYSNFYKDKMRRENTLENIATLQDKREAIIERSFWEYIQHKQGLYKTRKTPGKQSLFSGVLRCGAAGAIITLLNITTAPIMWAIEALALIPTIFVWIH